MALEKVKTETGHTRGTSRWTRRAHAKSAAKRRRRHLDKKLIKEDL